MQHLIRNYIEEPSAKKRELFPFDLKLRGISLLSFFDNNQLVEKYLQRYFICYFQTCWLKHVYLHERISNCQPYVWHHRDSTRPLKYQPFRLSSNFLFYERFNLLKCIKIYRQWMEHLSKLFLLITQENLWLVSKKFNFTSFSEISNQK